jgi:CheY-like chemotaxis protein
MVSEPAETAAAKTVLVVDDDEMFCVLVSGLLEIQGYRSVVAPSGAPALKMLEDPEHKFDAVLLDFSMKPMNGRQILVLLRRISPSMPVVMMSGSEKEDIVEAGSQEAHLAFLLKPFSSKALARAIQLACAASPAAAAR